MFTVHGREKVYLTFSCNTGGDMGMNMVTKGVHTVIEYLTYDFPYMDVIGIFGKFLCVCYWFDMIVLLDCSL